MSPISKRQRTSTRPLATSGGASGSSSGSASSGPSSTSCWPSATAPESTPRPAPLDRFGDAAWIHGGSPTNGFLAFGADGPFKGFYNSLAGTAFADWMFMAALLGIGVAFTFGVFTRIAAGAGALAVPDDVERRAAPREQPAVRRAHHRMRWSASCSASTPPVATSGSVAGGRSSPSSGASRSSSRTSASSQCGGPARAGPPHCCRAGLARLMRMRSVAQHLDS